MVCWDGKAGYPGAAHGEAIPAASRVAMLARDAAVLHHLGGAEAARAMAQELAGEAARRAGLGERDRTELEHAGLVHDLGRVAVSATVWQRPGRLSDDD